MGIRVGIDLGTTFSVVAYVNPETKKAQVIPNKYGKRSTPSVVAFLNDGTILAGEDAMDYEDAYDATFVSLFKRCMGNPEYKVLVGGKVYTATDLSAILLHELVSDASETLGEAIHEVVITVPAYFTQRERKATMEACKIAGLTVLGMINEPTAAAFSYHKKWDMGDKTILVYDLGGGTFDTTIAAIRGETIEILGSNGNHDLGGREWDDTIARYVAERFYEEHGIDLSGEELQHKVMLQAEQVKKKLSDTSVATFQMMRDGKLGTYPITEELFEKMSSSLMDLTKECVNQLLELVGLTSKELDGVLLIGGATQMKMVHQFVEEELGLPVLAGVHAKEAVALGAAKHADIFEQGMDYLPAGQRVVDVAPHSLGMIAVSADGNWYVNSILIPKNTKVPVSKTRAFTICPESENGELEIYLLQGEGDTPSECDIVGKYVCSGIEQGGCTECKLYVTYTYNEDGMIEVNAKQSENEKELQVHMEEVFGELDWLQEGPKKKKEERRICPGTIYIAIDLSGSMAGVPLAEAKMAMLEFVAQLDLKQFQVGLIAFADKVRIVLEPTNQLLRMQRAVQSLRVSGRVLGYGNAVNPFATIYEAFRNPSTEDSKYAVILTDGVWSYQEYAIREALLCQEAEIEIFALGFGYADHSFLEKIASKKDLAILTELSNLTEDFVKIAKVIREKGSSLRIMDYEN